MEVRPFSPPLDRPWGGKPSSSGVPSSVTASNDDDNADSKKDDANGAGGAGEASGTARAASKRQLAVVIGTGSDGSSDSDGSDADGDSAPSDKRCKLDILLDNRDDSKKGRSSKHHRTGRK